MHSKQKNIKNGKLELPGTEPVSRVSENGVRTIMSNLNYYGTGSARTKQKALHLLRSRSSGYR
jgi:hypothetical protein